VRQVCGFPLNANPGIVVLPDDDPLSKSFAAAVGWMLLLVGPFEELWRGSKIVIGRYGETTSITSREGGRTERTLYRRHGPFAQFWRD
jgi:hypothetical protein